MLKIKDDVDLKELEKFGFIFYRNKYKFTIDDLTAVVIYQNRTIHLCSSFYLCSSFICLSIPSVVYDLIQAGLVEKVSDEE